MSYPTLRFLIHGFWAGRKSYIFGVWVAPAAPQKGGGRSPTAQKPCIKNPSVCYAIMLPGRQSGFRAGFRLESIREGLTIAPPKAGRTVDFDAFPIRIWPNLGRKHDFRPGNTIA